MKKSYNRILLTGAAAVASLTAFADPYTPPAQSSQVQTHIRLDVKDDTKEVKFINTNNDPWIFTKVYQLKHADPYEIRPYVRQAVQTYRVTPANPTHIDNGTPSSVAGPGAAKVEVIRYMDGAGFLVVSAEEYRFGKQPNGSLGIDELIEKLDQPDILSSSGRKQLVYYPRFIDAVYLRDLLLKSGVAMTLNDPDELDQGKDRIRPDAGLNALFMQVPLANVKTVQEMISLYDQLVPEAKIKYTIYELEYENDGKLGADFQSWKNGPGTDLFSIAGRWSNGWDPVNLQPARPYVGQSNTQFINFSPKWNTKYLDFLTSKGKGRVLTSGELALMNSAQGTVSSTQKLASIQNGTQIAGNANLNQYIRLTNVKWDDGSAVPTTTATPYVNPYGRYRITGAIDETGQSISLIDYAGNPIGLNNNGAVYNFVITKTTVGTETYYYLQIGDTSGDTLSANFVNASGKNYGKKVKVFDVTLQRAVNVVSVGSGNYTLDWSAVTSWSSDQSLAVARDVTRVTNLNSYGFTLTLTPNIKEKISTVDVYMSNTNLIGFKNTGVPRTSYSEYSTKINVDNSGKQYVIGGVTKEELVRSVDKVPYLGDIPVLGWAFSSEGESIKKSRIVAVLEANVSRANEPLKANVIDIMKDTKKSLNDAGTKAWGFIDQPDYGYDQFILDREKVSLDPLP